MFNWWLLFWWAISVVAFLSYLLLSYAFRDFSFLLLAQSSFTFLGLIIPTVLLTKHYKLQPNIVIETEDEDEETEKLSHWYQYIDDDEPDSLANGFLKSCR